MNVPTVMLYAEVNHASSPELLTFRDSPIMTIGVTVCASVTKDRNWARQTLTIKAISCALDHGETSGAAAALASTFW